MCVSYLCKEHPSVVYEEVAEAFCFFLAESKPLTQKDKPRHSSLSPAEEEGSQVAQQEMEDIHHREVVLTRKP